MNAKIKSSGLIILLLILSSCNDFLKEDYFTSVNTSYFADDVGIETSVNTCYYQLRDMYGSSHGNGMSEVLSDIWVCKPGSGIAERLFGDLSLDASYDRIYLMWETCYIALNRCNEALDWLNKYTGNNSNVQTRIGEVKFLRALCLWHIVEYWGGVHFSLEPSVNGSTEATNADEDTFYNQIFADLKEAEEALPYRGSETDWGRANKEAAQILMSRVHFFLGRKGDGSDSQEHLEKARDYAKKVIENGKCSLEPIYKDVWDIHKEQNSEVIFSVQMSSNYTLNNGWTERGQHMHFLCDYRVNPTVKMTINGGRPFARWMPNQHLLDIFRPYRDIDQRYDASFREYWPANVKSSSAPGLTHFWKDGDAEDGFGDADTAVYAVNRICTDEELKKMNDKKIGKNFLSTNTLFTGDHKINDKHPYFFANKLWPSLTKHSDPTRLTPDEYNTSRDVYVFRISEAYLILSEAYWRLGDDANAVYWLNKYREKRAKSGHFDEFKFPATVKIDNFSADPGDWNTVAEELSTDFYLDERAREFCGEFLRWHDLRSLGKDFLTAKLSEYHAVVRTYNTATINSRFYYYPIPQTAIDQTTNWSEENQNPGWY